MGRQEELDGELERWREAVFERAARRHGLRGRRREVARLYFLGRAEKQICVELDMHEGTVRAHIRRMRRTCGTSGRTEFVHAVYAAGARA